MKFFVHFFLAALASGLFLELHGADENSSLPFGIEERVPWTTSQIRGSPEPPLPFRAARVFPKIKFKEPVDLTSAPGIDRLFVAELGGKIYSFNSATTTEKGDLVFDVKKVPGGNQIFGFTFHPQFSSNNFVYICYIAKDDPEGTHVSRFTMTGFDPPRIDPGTEKILISWLAGGHARLGPTSSRGDLADLLQGDAVGRRPFAGKAQQIDRRNELED